MKKGRCIRPIDILDRWLHFHVRFAAAIFCQVN